MGLTEELDSVAAVRSAPSDATPSKVCCEQTKRSTAFLIHWCSVRSGKEKYSSSHKQYRRGIVVTASTVMTRRVIRRSRCLRCLVCFAILAAGNSLPATVNVRKNTDKNHDEGIQHITQTMREMASEANAVDGELYQFVLARFCDRLNEADLLEHPLVMDELERFYSIYER